MANMSLYLANTYPACAIGLGFAFTYLRIAYSASDNWAPVEGEASMRRMVCGLGAYLEPKVHVVAVRRV